MQFLLKIYRNTICCHHMPPHRRYVFAVRVIAFQTGIQFCGKYTNTICCQHLSPLRNCIVKFKWILPICLGVEGRLTCGGSRLLRSRSRQHSQRLVQSLLNLQRATAFQRAIKSRLPSVAIVTRILRRLEKLQSVPTWRYCQPAIDNGAVFKGVSWFTTQATYAEFHSI